MSEGGDGLRSGLWKIERHQASTLGDLLPVWSALSTPLAELTPAPQASLKPEQIRASCSLGSQLPILAPPNTTGRML